MTRDSFMRLQTPLPPKLVRVLSLVDCLYRLGCSEEEAGELLDEWLEHEESPVVGFVSREVRATGPAMAAAA